MTTTVEPPVNVSEQAATEQEQTTEQPKFWTVTDTYWLSERGIPADYVFEQMPRSDHPTSSAYGRNRLYLYVGYPDIYDGNASGTSKSGRLYVYVSPGNAVEHPGPSTQQQRRDEVLATLAGMTPEQVMERYVADALRWKESYMSLHHYAEQNNYCPTFDNIMEANGWPRRPKKYRVTMRVRMPFTIDTAFLQRFIAREYELPSDFNAQGWKWKSHTVTTEPLTIKPTKGMPVAELFPGEGKVRELFVNYFGEPALEGADWSSVEVIEVGR